MERPSHNDKPQQSFSFDDVQAKEKSENAIEGNPFLKIDALLREFEEAGKIKNKSFVGGAYLQLYNTIKEEISSRKLNEYLYSKGYFSGNRNYSYAPLFDTPTPFSKEENSMEVKPAAHPAPPARPPVVSQKDLAANDKHED